MDSPPQHLLPLRVLWWSGASEEEGQGAAESRDAQTAGHFVDTPTDLPDWESLRFRTVAGLVFVTDLAGFVARREERQ